MRPQACSRAPLLANRRAQTACHALPGCSRAFEDQIQELMRKLAQFQAHLADV